MPYNKDAYSRYKLIDQRIRHKQKPAPTLAQLVEYVSDKLGKSVSVSSIQKDIEAMRYDVNLNFNAPIAFDRYSRGYVYTEADYAFEKMNLGEEDLQGLEMALGILQQFKSVPSIKYFEEEISKMASAVKKNRSETTNQNFFLLDRPQQYKGSEFMSDLVDAIREKKVIKILYQTFNKPQPKEHTVHPYFIKEYDGRLYLIANDVAKGKAPKFLTFSLDRMTKITGTYDSFKEEYVDKSNYYTHALGVSHVDATPQEIVLSFHPNQAGYLKTQLFHNSQKILIDNEKEFQISLMLVVNIELQMRILSFGSKVKVISPKILVDFVKNEVKELANFYK